MVTNLALAAHGPSDLDLPQRTTPESIHEVINAASGVLEVKQIKTNIQQFPRQLQSNAPGLDCVCRQTQRGHCIMQIPVDLLQEGPAQNCFEGKPIKDYQASCLYKLLVVYAAVAALRTTWSSSSKSSSSDVLVFVSVNHAWGRQGGGSKPQASSHDNESFQNVELRWKPLSELWVEPRIQQGKCGGEWGVEELSLML